MPSSELEKSQPPTRLSISDEMAYWLPMAVFLIFTQMGVWWPTLYPATYVAKTFIVAGLLFFLWPHYTKIRWNYWMLGIFMGVLGVVQWVGMETLLTHFWPHHNLFAIEPYNPFDRIHPRALCWAFIIIRWADAALVVPVMEELFWRDYLWRTILAPNDFKLAAVGEKSLKALIIVSVVFSFVHVECFTAIVWGLMIGALLMFTRSLGAAIIMHGVTNFLLGLYVLKTGAWHFW